MFLEVSSRKWFGERTISGYVVEEDRGYIAEWVLDEADERRNSAFIARVDKSILPLPGLSEAVISRSGIHVGHSGTHLKINRLGPKTYSFEENMYHQDFGGVGNPQYGPRPLEDTVSLYKGIADLLFKEYDKKKWKA